MAAGGIDHRRGRPVTPLICENLLVRLDPSSREDALRVLQVGSVLAQHEALSMDHMMRLCLAMSALKRWEDLLKACDQIEERFGSRTKITMFRALAFDHLGDTPRALGMLRSLVEADRFEPRAIETYAYLAARCGLIEEAQRSFETLYSHAANNREESKALLALLKLEMARDLNSPRLMDYWNRLGAVIDPEEEVSEGTYLLLRLQITAGRELSDDEIKNYQLRLAAYQERFPESRVLRSIKIPKTAEGEDLLEIIAEHTGQTLETWKHQQDLAEPVRRGVLQPPYSLRSYFLPEIQDTISLFEATLRGNKEAREYVLNIANRADLSPETLLKISRGFPLVDEISLLVLHELSLIHHLFSVFPRVAITKATLTRLHMCGQGHLVSIHFRRARALSGELARHVDKIHQIHLPSDDEPGGFLEELEDLRRKFSGSSIIFFSDDLRNRQHVLSSSADPSLRSLNTPEFIALLRSRNLLSDKAAAKIVSEVCGWNIANLAINFIDILRVLEGTIEANDSTHSILGNFRRNGPLQNYLQILWDSRIPYERCLKEAYRFLGFLVAAPELEEPQGIRIETYVVTAFWIEWHIKMTARQDCRFKNDEIQHLGMTVVGSASEALVYLKQNKSKTQCTAQRIWSSHRAALEFLAGDRMSQEKESALFHRSACLLAMLESDKLRDSASQMLVSGLNDASPERTLFNETYVNQRVKIVSNSN